MNQFQDIEYVFLNILIIDTQSINFQFSYISISIKIGLNNLGNIFIIAKTKNLKLIIQFYKMDMKKA